MKHYIVQITLALAISILSAPSSLAQSSKLTPKLTQGNKLTTVKPIQSTKQILPPDITKMQEVPTVDLVLPPPPNTRIFYATCDNVIVTKLSYQFNCHDWNRGTLEPDASATFVLRRDGTEPDWAMNSDDFPLVDKILKDRLTAGVKYDGISGWTGEYDDEGEPIYVRQLRLTILPMYSIQEQSAPLKYCSVNPQQFSRDPRNTSLCLDLMSIQYNGLIGSL